MKVIHLMVFFLSVLLTHGSVYAKDSKSSYQKLGRKLTKAAYQGNARRVRSLLNAGADIDFHDGEALRVAVNTGSVEVVRLIVQRQGYTNVSVRATEVLTHYWAVRNASEVIRLLLTVSPDVNVVDVGGRSPLVWYAWTGDANVLRLLIAAGANVNYINREQSTQVTALCAATMSGRPTVEAIEVLLSAGADPNVICRHKYYGSTTALGAALMTKQTNLADALIRGGALLPQ